MMTKNEFYYLSADGKTEIHALKWMPEGKPVAVLQIAHGVTEYIERYEELAEFFTKRGFIVTGNDHLGHGASIAPNGFPMYFGPAGSWDYVVEDIHACKEKIQNEYPEIPYCILGFSLGSFVVRTYLIRYPKMADVVVIVGTGQTPPIQIALAKFLADKEAEKYGEEQTSPLIKKLTFETYNKKFSPNRTEMDWLCSDNASLDRYIASPLRGKYMSAGLFRELLSGMAYTGKAEQVRKMNKHTPVLFVSGGDDPVGSCGKGVKRAYKSFLKAGLVDVNMKLYPGLRHDVLHEACREEIYNYIYQWLRSRINGVLSKTE